MMGTFSASVEEFATESLKDMTDIRNQAAQMLVNEVRTPVTKGGRLPIKDGNLRRSFMASTSAMPMVQEGKGLFPADPAGEIKLVIAGASIEDTIYIGVQAAYGPRMEYGFVGTDSLGREYNQQGFAFVRSAAQRWQAIVNEAAAIVRGRRGSR